MKMPLRRSKTVWRFASVLEKKRRENFWKK
uniref:Uncharacterized protein n=1 Tax=Candidatus Methanophagaceae archaeon ANME-1 ERB6 TaxID=2759912 RepID=A0A7G9YTL4_9EURY|nr:hypothetical protein HDBBLJII_00045 [Methanosarcinales archaeon ANME-1 ERB6]